MRYLKRFILSWKQQFLVLAVTFGLYTWFLLLMEQ